VKEEQAKEAGTVSVRSFAYQEANSDPKGGGYRGDGGLAGRVNTGTRNRRTVWTIATQKMTLRSDLTQEQREHVISELLKRGVF